MVGGENILFILVGVAGWPPATCSTYYLVICSRSRCSSAFIITFNNVLNRDTGKSRRGSSAQPTPSRIYLALQDGRWAEIGPVSAVGSQTTLNVISPMTLVLSYKGVYSGPLVFFDLFSLAIHKLTYLWWLLFVTVVWLCGLLVFQAIF